MTAGRADGNGLRAMWRRAVGRLGNSANRPGRTWRRLASFSEFALGEDFRAEQILICRLDFQEQIDCAAPVHHGSFAASPAHVSHQATKSAKTVR